MLYREAREAQLPEILPKVEMGIRTNANIMFDTMRANFDIAVSISPLTMLIYMSPHKSAVSRENLIRVSVIR